MGLHYSFVDDESYGTEDINNITGELTGAGIAPFPTKDSYSTSDLNGLTSALVGSGTSLDGCKCTYSAENGTVTVAQGIIFFGNGTRLRVDEDGYSVGVTNGAAGYVYAVCNTAVQTAEIKFAAALPASGDYVALCQLTADGNIYDKRVFARSKVATFGTNATYEFAFTDETVTESGSGCSIVLPVNAGKFNYIVTTNSHVDKTYNYTFGVYDLKNEKWISLITNTVGKYGNVYTSIAGEVSVSVASGQITISSELTQYVMGLHMALV